MCWPRKSERKMTKYPSKVWMVWAQVASDMRNINSEWLVVWKTPHGTVTDSIAKPSPAWPLSQSVPSALTPLHLSSHMHLASSHATTPQLTSSRLVSQHLTLLYFASPHSPHNTFPRLVSTHLASPHRDSPFHPETVMMDVWLMLLVSTLQAQNTEEGGRYS